VTWRGWCVSFSAGGSWLKQALAERRMTPERPFVAAGSELLLSGAALKQLMEGVLGRGAPFRFRAGGSSMLPFVRDGDVICVSPLERAPGPGDVVAFVHATTGRLVVHRVVARRGDLYTLRGDNAGDGPDGEVGLDALLGRVTEVRRGDRPVRLGLGPERYLIAVLSRVGWLPGLTQWLAQTKRLLVRER
jgi:signal peptidase I